MILSIIGTLILYWVFWRLYKAIIPHIVSQDTPEFIKNPTFWQFAISLFVLLFFMRKFQ